MSAASECRTSLRPKTGALQAVRPSATKSAGLGTERRTFLADSSQCQELRAGTSRAPIYRGFYTFIFVALLLLLVGGCRSVSSTQSLQRYEFSSTHMGTLFSITLYAREKTVAQEAAYAAFQEVARLDDILSDYKADSELLMLCDKPYHQPVQVSESLFDVLEQSWRFSKLSDGAFDFTVGPEVRLWRFARKRKVLPSTEEIRNVRGLVGYQKVLLDRKTRSVTLLEANMRLDLGGIAKGYAADRALAVLKSKGVDRALVAASGDIAVGKSPPGSPGWRVAISSMKGTTNQATVLLHDAGISTSGDLEQFVEIDGVRYSHIVDPSTGMGLTNRIQVTIVAPNATTTDALATGVSVLGPDRGLALVNSLPKTAALIISGNNGAQRTFASRRFKNISSAERN